MNQNPRPQQGLNIGQVRPMPNAQQRQVQAPGQKPAPYYPYLHQMPPYPQHGLPYPSPYYADPKELMRREIDKVIPPKKGGAWRGLEFRPEKVQFANQDFDEKVYIIVRKHWSANTSWILKNIFYAFLPVIIFTILNVVDIGTDFMSFKTMFLGLTFYYSIILTNVIRDFFDWFFDPYIVTDLRIIHYEFKPFSSYTIKETYLTSIETVRERSGGPLANLFGYGDVTITTPSENVTFDFKSIPQSTLVRDIISDLQRIAKQYHG